MRRRAAADGCAHLMVTAECADGDTRCTPAVNQLGDGKFGGFARVSDEAIENASIVGFWEFEFHLNGAQNGFADRFLLDWGLATLHDDGTEVQFCAGRSPRAGD
jgi:hypothetical protein